LSTCVSCCMWYTGGSFQDSFCASGRAQSVVLFCFVHVLARHAEGI